MPFTGSGPSRMKPRLLLADSLPAVIWFRGIPNADAYSVRFRRANNIHGAAWAPAVNIQSLSPNFEQLSELSFDVAEVAGHPAVAFVDGFSGQVVFKRAANAQGSSWTGSGVNAAAATDWETRVSLAVINGIPAVAVREVNLLAYRRANNATGGAWFGVPPNLKSPDIGLGFNIQMLEVAGQPAVFYNSRYIRSGQLPIGAANWFAVAAP